MAEVYIDSLTIDNFGPFYGEHSFDFRSLDGKCGILIGGRNGAGKTHLLRAMYLAIVGESGIGDLKKVETGSDATRFSFEKSLNRRAANEGKDTIILKARVTYRDSEVGSRNVEFIRSIRFRPNSPPVWKHLATRSDSPGEIEDEQVIQKLRDAFLPRHLARFFFFDAERSQSVNLSQQDIIEGVSRILGYHTYSELEGDLRQLINTKIPRVFNSNGGQDLATILAELNGRVITAEGVLNARKKELVHLEQELRETESELLEVEDDLKTLGVVDPEEIEKAQTRHSEITQVKAKLEESLQSAWEGALPISLLSSFRKELHEALQAEERRREWEGAKHTVEPKIPHVKNEVFGNQPDEFSLSPDVESFYMKRLEEALNGLFHPPPEGMPDTVFIADRNDTSAQVRHQLSVNQAEVRSLAHICSEIETMDAELRELNQKLKQNQQNTAAFKRGSELHEKRGELLSKRARADRRLKEVQTEISTKEVEVGELKRQESNQREIVDKAEKGESLAILASRYREAASEIKSRAAIQMRQEIAKHVGDLWVEITERDKEFSGMEFDSHWQCWLTRLDGTKSTWEETNTSAGQRQVRMLAFYEALRRLAKLVPPLVVDTPLARLDKQVRENVLDKLYLTGHQTIIMATNSEVDPDSEMFGTVSERLARVYTLQPTGDPGQTDYAVKVASDYFGKPIS